MLNLFTGSNPQFWEKRVPSCVEVINVDILNGQNMLDDNLMSYLLQVANEGKLLLMTAGPPCRSVSVCRHRNDNGPRPVRRRCGDGRWCAPDLLPHEQHLAWTDGQLWLRTLMFRVAKMGNPYMHSFVETPADPQSYLGDQVQYPTFTCWPEVLETLENVLQLNKSTFDQGCLGHQRKKPTTTWSDLSEINMFDGLRDDNPRKPWPKDVGDAVEESRKLAAWAPMLKDALVEAVKRLCKAPAIRVVASDKQMQELRDWYQHLAQDHMPARRDCVQCLEGAGRDKPRKRIEFPGAYTFSIDVGGPFKVGGDQDRKTAKYMLVAVLTVPMKHDKPLIAGWRPSQKDDPKTGGDEFEPWFEKLELNHGDVNPFEDETKNQGTACQTDREGPSTPSGGQTDREGEKPHSGGRTDREGELPHSGERDVYGEEGSVESEVEVVVTDDAAGLANFKTKVADLQQVTVSNLTFAIPLVSRKETHVMDAISTVYTKLRALQVPVYRINTDRAREFVSARFRSWCLARDLEFTASAGDEPTGNARVEQEIGSVKRATRVLLKSAGLDETFWPLALRHAGEYILRRQLEQFGLRQPKLLPFGSQVLVKRKTWKMRGEAWRWPMEKAVVLGPAEGMSASSNAHWVQLEDGTGFRTTIAVRPRFSATAKDGAVECLRPLLELDDRGEEILDEHDEPCPSLAEGEFEAARDEWIAEMEKQDPHKTTMVELDTTELQVVAPAINDPAKVPTRRFRGKQSQPPVEATGGESRVAKMVVEWNVQDTMVHCSGCGLKQVAVVKKCQTCDTEIKQHDAHEHVAQYLKYMRDVQNFDEHVSFGYQQLLQDETVRALAHLTEDSGEVITKVKTALRNISAGESVVNEQIGSALQDLNTNGLLDEQVLQTYIVGRKEILSEGELWKPVVQKEINDLLGSKTLYPVSPQELKRLQESGEVLETIPGKLICSRKAPDGKRKARIVACGNFSNAGVSVETSTGGLDAVALRTLLAVAAQRDYAIGVIDVQKAFLQAPRRATKEKTTLVRPPNLAVALGCIDEHTLWGVSGALYGLQESPGDWKECRDDGLRTSTWTERGSLMKLIETAESNVWSVVWGDGTVGYLGTYVDDLITMGDEWVVNSTLKHVASLWKCTEPSILSTSGTLRFCGMEITKDHSGLTLHQESYTKDLAERHGITTGSKLGSLFASFTDGPDEELSCSALREAQGVIGELHWLTTHTRPDVAYHVGVASRLMHKRPKYVVQLAKEILGYLKSTEGVGLRYERVTRGDDFGDDNQLRFAKGLDHVEAYADASFAPACEGYRSVHGTVTCVAGCAVMWSSSKQTLIAQSTAEAELLAFMETHQQSEGIACLIEVLGVKDVKRCLYGDSKAALALCQGDVGAWRTRHLRLRAAGLRNHLMKQKPVWFSQLKLVGLLGMTTCQLRNETQLRNLHAGHQGLRGWLVRAATAAGLMILCGLLAAEHQWLLGAAAGLLVLIKEKKEKMGRVNQPPTVGGTENHEKPGARENEPTPDGKKDKSQNERRKCESQDMTHVHTHTGSVGHFGEYETTADGWVYHQGTWETPRSFWEVHQRFREKPGCALWE